MFIEKNYTWGVVLFQFQKWCFQNCCIFNSIFNSNILLVKYIIYINLNDIEERNAFKVLPKLCMCILLKEILFKIMWNFIKNQIVILLHHTVGLREPDPLQVNLNIAANGKL